MNILIQRTSETFNLEKNRYISAGILRLLNLGGKNPPMDLSVQGELPGWKNDYDSLI